MFSPFLCKNNSTGISHIDQYLHFGDFPDSIVQVAWSVVKEIKVLLQLAMKNKNKHFWIVRYH